MAHLSPWLDIWQGKTWGKTRHHLIWTCQMTHSLNNLMIMQWSLMLKILSRTFPSTHSGYEQSVRLHTRRGLHQWAGMAISCTWYQQQGKHDGKWQLDEVQVTYAEFFSSKQVDEIRPHAVIGVFTCSQKRSEIHWACRSMPCSLLRRQLILSILDRHLF